MRRDTCAVLCRVLEEKEEEEEEALEIVGVKHTEEFENTSPSHERWRIGLVAPPFLAVGYGSVWPD
ncbi:hypothetical protein E2C01_038571 [Portunus trituberculatus]|uniref:Uncharacterized protein n=1 Tax=Portunus trituberculatus TaxID=210409 RepID=A0A5B7FB57_PORTR|nr:hypothetical protein [Portunus trituberculatus]